MPSKPIIEELSEHGLTTIQLLPHGVDTNTFNPGFARKDWKQNHGIEGKTALLFAGRLVWEKDLLTLAQTYKLLTEKRDDVVFVLAGDGPIRKELEKLMPKALFLGYQSGEELSAAYASSDIFVFPSTTETFGNVTVEAMASGIPPICAREGGAFGMINNGVNGLIAEPRDPNDLAYKIEILLNKPDFRKKLAENAYNFAITQSWQNIVDRLLFSYNEVIKNYHFKLWNKKLRVA